MIDCASPFLNCPRCGLSIRLKVSPLTVEYCPRCMARARIPVQVVLLHASRAVFGGFSPDGPDSRA